MFGQPSFPPGGRRPGPGGGAGAEPLASGGAVLESGGAVLESGGAVLDELNELEESDELDVEPSDCAHAAAPDPSTSPASAAATHIRFNSGAMCSTLAVQPGNGLCPSAECAVATPRVGRMRHRRTPRRTTRARRPPARTTAPRTAAAGSA